MLIHHRHWMLVALLIAASSGTPLFAPAAWAESERGQALYENHCQFCHESWAHKRDGNRITSLNSLRQSVAAWSVHSGLGWGDDEIGDVTDYLNRHFYRLTVKP